MMLQRILPTLIASATLLAAQSPRQPNVVIILPDQLRADRLHCYGNPRPTSPNIDQLASSGVLFQHYYSNAPWTQPSQATLVTSLYPSRHGRTLLLGDNDNLIPYPPEAHFLAELFHQAGYATAAFINNNVAGKYLLGRGFDLFDEDDGYTGAPASLPGAVNGRILNWVDRAQGKPFFVYVDYWQPHYPYAPPPEHDIFQNDAYPEKTIAGYEAGQQDLFRWSNTGDPLALERVGQLYDGYVHYIDEYIGELAQSFRDRGLYDNTIFLITSDHGELLFSHPNDFDTSDHRSLFDTAVQVPAILFGAGIPQGKVVTGLAAHIDMAPTLLDLAGLAPNQSAQGQSLAPAIQGNADSADSYVFSESDLEIRQRSVRDGRYKLILTVDTGAVQLFDTQLDPLEKNDIAAEEPDVTDSLSAVLDQWRAENEPSADLYNQRAVTVTSYYPTIEVIADDATTVHLAGGGWSIVYQPDRMAGPRYWSPPLSYDQHHRSITWRTNNPKPGRYRISMRNGTPSGVNIASNAPVTIVSAQGAATVQVDQTKGESAWQVLGDFDTPVTVTLSNAANGWIVAGEVMYQKLQ